MRFLINEQIYWVNKINVYTLLQFCYKHLIENIPRFCYHEKLLIAGNCRMCLVEDIKSLKPIVACTIIVTLDSSFYTKTFKVKKAREAMLEFLLINHPLDCPICCQGGECDLQDLSELVGADKGRYYEVKRAVINKNLGPLVKTLMNRCIHCTRCIRFSLEIGNIYDLGVLGRGVMMEIGTYIEKFLDSNFSGNLVDICPVGALTSKPYSFVTRSWELTSYIVPNIYDIFLNDIRLDVRGGSILRILPIYNIIVDHEWLDDNIRFCYDSLKYQRLLYPLLNLFNNFVYIQSWRSIFYIIRHFFINTFYWLLKNKFKYISCFFLTGKVLGIKAGLIIKYFNMISIIIKKNIIDFKNIVFKDTEWVFKTIFVFSHNFEYNFPSFYLKIKEFYLKSNINCFGQGLGFLDSSFFKRNWMNIFFFLEGKHLLSFFYKDSKMFVEQSFFEKLLYLVNYLQRYKIFCIDNIAILPTSISEITKSYLNISDKFTVYSNTSFFIYNLAQDNISYLSNLNKGMIIYQGFIGDLGVNNSNIILPVKFYYEDINYMDDMYMRCDGVYKSISSGVFSPKYVYSNLDVLRQMLINLDLFFNVNSKNWCFLFFFCFYNYNSYYNYNYFSNYNCLLNLINNRESLFINSKVLRKIKTIYSWRRNYVR